MSWQTSPLLTRLVDYTRLGLVTDVDGTISYLVEQPDAARVTPHSRDLLQALQRHLALVAVISGRAARDVQAMVDLPGVVIIGNHGLEWWRDGSVEIAPLAAAYRPALEAAAAAIRTRPLPGLFVEDKGATLSIHYRRTADPAATASWLADFLPEIAGEHNLKVFQGNMIFELRPPVGIDKGSAFQQLVERHRLDAAVYLGDDTTDVDALRMARHLRDGGTCYAVGLGVASDHTPPALRDAADLLLSGVQDVETFLGWLLNAVIASST
jgi:trehalose 6-phosphate phosphatase